MAPESPFITTANTIDTVDGELSLEAVIARFAADDSRVSHALPVSLSLDQRQLAKKLVALHTQLECESYGFGPERQLHLFKKRSRKSTGCSGVKGVRMRVKNTFIDAWLEGTDCKFVCSPMCSPIFRSLPSDLRTGVIVASKPMANQDGNVQDAALPCRPTKPPDVLEPQLSTGRSCESVQDVGQVCDTPSPCSSPKQADFPKAPILTVGMREGVQDVGQVHCTSLPCNSPQLADFQKPPMLTEFDCESVPDVAQVCDTPSPCNTPNLSACLDSQMPTEVCDIPRTEFATSEERTLPTDHSPTLVCMSQTLAFMPPPVSPSNMVTLAEGTAVEIDGLVQRPDYNGKSGTVQSWDPVLRRYNVILDKTFSDDSGPRQVKTKRENLRLITPPPPAHAAGIAAPTIDLSACIPLVSEDVFPSGSGELTNLGLTSQSPGSFPNYCAAPPAASPVTSPVPPDGTGWYSWQFSDDVSPQAWHNHSSAEEEANPSALAGVEHFEGPGAAWEHGSTSMLASSDMISGFDSLDSATWQHLCDTDVTQGGWQTHY